MLSAAQIANDVSHAALRGGETIVYLAGGVAPGRTVPAVVRRELRATDGGDPRDLRHLRLRVHVTRRAIDGVPSVTVGTDQVQVRARVQDDAASVFQVVRVISRDAGSWQLELGR